VSRSVGLAHIIRQDDGTSTGVWGVYQIRSAFQPIFAFSGGRLSIAAFEGLVRPFRNGEPVGPNLFFANVPAVDRMHVETLSRTLHLLNAGACLDPKGSIFVNFDPSLFVERAVAENALRDMRLVLHEAGIDAARIVCEVTEQKSPSESALYAFIEALRRHGFRIAVDDYGAEDSDIRRIERLRPDIVKFDAHWITHLMNSGPGFALLSSMVETFRSKGITTVFEGIEHGWQLELAERAGAAMIQGFVLARPELAPTSFRVFAAEAAPLQPAAEPWRAPGPALAGRPAVPAKAFGRRAASP
jgi:EAL domain-containing protein (putative c-di-GMP-specific phosphodiesterase class I)